MSCAVAVMSAKFPLELEQQVTYAFFIVQILMEELILSKESSESEIKCYFNAVLELSKSDNEFPVNLNEVWMLVYNRRQEAIRALTSNEQFIKDVDYKPLRKNFHLFSLPFQKLCFPLQCSTFVYTNAGRELAYSVQVIFMTSLKIFRCYRTPV